MPRLASHFSYPILLVILPALWLSACSGSREDVRLTLCKNVTIELTGNKTEWQKQDIVIKGYEDLEVQLGFQENGQTGSATCFFSYEAVEENALTLSDPASAFATYPNRMLHNGKQVDRKIMVDKINAVLKKQGKKLLDKLDSGVQKADDFIRQTSQ